MKFSRRILAPLPIAIVAIALLACKKGGSPGEVKGSCDMRNSSGGGSKMCLDFHSEPNDRVRAICSPASGYSLNTTRCDTSSSLGGCQKGKITNWYYSSSRHSSADDVKRECGSDPFVAPGTQ
ncbi:MAG: hypothetical protein HYZ29_35410 [Myxococcales bacterium]|nr:hypothetical protein [Myxococcales bacterium]